MRAVRALGDVGRRPQRRARRDHVVRRHECLLDGDAVGAAGAHAERGVSSPVGKDGDLLARHDEHHLLVRSRHHDVADEMRGVRNARAVVPGAADQEAAFHPLAGAGRARRAVRHDDVPIPAEQLDLRLLRPVRCDECTVRCSQRQAPADAGIAAGDLHHRLVERGIVELVAAEAPGVQGAVEAGLDELLLQLGRVAPAGLRLVLLGTQPLAQRDRARDQLGRRQTRLGCPQMLPRPLARLGAPPVIAAHRAIRSISRASASGAVTLGLWLASISRNCHALSARKRLANWPKVSSGVMRVQ
jgi:hypothetical protein